MHHFDVSQSQIILIPKKIIKFQKNLCVSVLKFLLNLQLFFQANVNDQIIPASFIKLNYRTADSSTAI